MIPHSYSMRSFPPATPSWADDIAEVSDLWDHLEEQGWACDNGRRPNPSDFFRQAHKYSAERDAMIREQTEAA